MFTNLHFKHPNPSGYSSALENRWMMFSTSSFALSFVVATLDGHIQACCTNAVSKAITVWLRSLNDFTYSTSCVTIHRAAGSGTWFTLVILVLVILLVFTPLIPIILWVAEVTGVAVVILAFEWIGVLVVALPVPPGAPSRVMARTFPSPSLSPLFNDVDVDDEEEEEEDITDLQLVTCYTNSSYFGQDLFGLRRGSVFITVLCFTSGASCCSRVLHFFRRSYHFNPCTSISNNAKKFEKSEWTIRGTRYDIWTIDFFRLEKTCWAESIRRYVGSLPFRKEQHQNF